ncbi:hypothetical protein CYMTET_9618 [Cymbomonas tetramitiformis]|uniref:Uncharacterized protein n=1 Tax=Cymbomonas tetramitiformis TaxID=36881 RepID=A0AAE0GR49_9CHLO|nr:hypothetical protein CYMTET_9618 [Cymbomonas tetramitiformis]
MTHRPSEGEVLELDFSAHIEHLADEIEAILAQPDRLDKTGKAAGAKSRAWSEAANGAQLTNYLKDFMRKSSLVKSKNFGLFVIEDEQLTTCCDASSVAAHAAAIKGCKIA